MHDLLSHGRFELGVGKGITPFETGIVSSEGSRFYDFVELKLPFDPVQDPHPPLWTAGKVETAGRGGNNFIFPTVIPEQMRARHDELRAESREHRWHPNPHVAEPWIARCQVLLVIADTDRQAYAIARRGWSTWTKRFQRTHVKVRHTPADGDACLGQSSPAVRDTVTAGVNVM